MSFFFLRCAHFAIYDGHGGRLAAEFAQKNLNRNVLSAGLPRELVCFAWSISMHICLVRNLELGRKLEKIRESELVI